MKIIRKIKKYCAEYYLEIAVTGMIAFMILFCAAVIGINLVYGF